MTPQEISAACAEAMGWKRKNGCWWDDKKMRRFLDRFDPYHSIADAWVLVEFASKGSDFILDNMEIPDKWMASFFLGSGKGWIDDVADTAPASICLAFLEWAKARKDRP